MSIDLVWWDLEVSQVNIWSKSDDLSPRKIFTIKNVANKKLFTLGKEKI